MATVESKKASSGQRHGSGTPHDQKIWNRIERAATDGGHELADILESFPVYIRRVNLTRFLAHYELYRMIKDLPGNIVECGVYRGASLLAFAKFLEIFHGGDRTRRVFGFDNFAGFESLHENDGPECERLNKVTGGWNASPFYQELKEHIDVFHVDSYVPRAKRVVLVEGDLTQTAPEFVDQNPGLRISLLHLDVDLYEPTKAALDAFYPRVVRGGLVVFDEYGLTEWAGESHAVEEYFEGNVPRIQKFPFSSLPGGFFVKE
ncbi:MAG: TylF/MycF/NovP-related O-methyltransferase [Planctomycetota bacterium]|nr:TylF/MycF/NovP-related O-methyltransferase [Planctomycetota bacterium]